MAKGSLEISTYQPPTPIDSSASHLCYGSRSSEQRTRWVAALVAGGLTLALHVLFIVSLEWGLGVGRSKPSEARTARLLPDGNGADAAAMQWVEVQESAEDGEEAGGLPDLAPVMQVVALPALPAMTPIDSPETEGQGGGSTDEESALSERYGLYLGQVAARVERAWLRPRTPIGARSFSCTARVEQDERGYVHEVTLVRCNGEPRWQQSLVRAIQYASPLPVPPDRRLSRRFITLTFRSEAYSATRNQDLYEPESVAGPPETDR